MGRKKVKLETGLTVRHGDTVILTFTGTYDADEDLVRAANGDRVWFDMATDVADYPGEVTVAKLRQATKHD